MTGERIRAMGFGHSWKMSAEVELPASEVELPVNGCASLICTFRSDAVDVDTKLRIAALSAPLSRELHAEVDHMVRVKYKGRRAWREGSVILAKWSIEVHGGHMWHRFYRRSKHAGMPMALKNSYLFAACRYGHIDLLNIVIDRDEQQVQQIANHSSFAFSISEAGSRNWGTAFRYACRNGGEIVDYMIARGIKKVVLDAWRHGLLGACRGGNEAVINRMIELGYPPDGDAFVEACASGNKPLAKFIFSYPRASPALSATTIDRALTKACKHGQKGTAKYCLRLGGKVHDLVKIARNGALEMAEFAVDYGAIGPEIVAALRVAPDRRRTWLFSRDPGVFHYRSGGPANAGDCLFAAGCELCDGEIIEFALRKFKVGAKRAFLAACSNGNSGLVEWIFAHIRAGPNTQNLINHGLVKACHRRKIETCVYLLELGANPSAALDKTESHKIARLLVARGATVKNGCTVNPNILVRHGAVTWSRMSACHTSIAVARGSVTLNEALRRSAGDCGDEWLIRELIVAGADDFDGLLIGACSCGNSSAAKLAIWHGATSFEAAFRAAAERKNRKLGKLLLTCARQKLGRDIDTGDAPPVKEWYLPSSGIFKLIEADYHGPKILHRAVRGVFD